MTVDTNCFRVRRIPFSLSSAMLAAIAPGNKTAIWRLVSGADMDHLRGELGPSFGAGVEEAIQILSIRSASSFSPGSTWVPFDASGGSAGASYLLSVGSMAFPGGVCGAVDVSAGGGGPGDLSLGAGQFVTGGASWPASTDLLLTLTSSADLAACSQGRLDLEVWVAGAPGRFPAANTAPISVSP